MSTTVLPTKLVKKFEAALLSQEEVKTEWIDFDEARRLLSRGKEMQRKTLQNYIYSGRIPTSCYRRTPNGKLFFDKHKLMGLKK
jgi:hypothetical protein